MQQLWGTARESAFLPGDAEVTGPGLPLENHCTEQTDAVLNSWPHPSHPVTLCGLTVPPGSRHIVFQFPVPSTTDLSPHPPRAAVQPGEPVPTFRLVSFPDVSELR